MLFIYAIIDLKSPPSAEDLAKIKDHQEHSLKEPGCTLYTFTRDLEKPERLHVVERFDSEPTFTAHMQLPRSAAFATWMKDKAGAVQVSRYEIAQDQSDAFSKESAKLMGDTVKRS